ncbi:hypothetical protein K449DRAFT_434507 [Hypoxylon sp. EC38]|nr:hypothetical protein K449DRAFT_434507 [Hypoxylon sp. EC38]
MHISVELTASYTTAKQIRRRDGTEVQSRVSPSASQPQPPTINSTNDFLKCSTICGIIRCRWCQGNPPHHFRPTKRPPNFLLLGEVEQEVMKYLPSRIPGSNINVAYQKPHGLHACIANDRETRQKLFGEVFINPIRGQASALYPVGKVVYEVGKRNRVCILVL